MNKWRAPTLRARFAFEQLEIVAKIPGCAATDSDLRFNPCWDDLTGDPRFEEFVAPLAPAKKGE
jgi:hypothetical protein